MREDLVEDFIKKYLAASPVEKEICKIDDS